MTTTQQLSAGIATLSKYFPVVFTHNGATYTGLRGSIKNTREMRDAGFLTEYDLNIRISKTLFTTRPQPNPKDTIVSNGIVFMVDSISEAPDGGIITLHCIKNK
jgi:hypothetical protein